MENQSNLESPTSRDPKNPSHLKQRFTLSSLEILFGSLVILGLIYMGYIILFQDSSGTASKMEKKIKILETSFKEQGEKLNLAIKANQDYQDRLESRLKALEAANQNLSAKFGKIEPRKAEEKKPPPAAPEKRKIQYKVKKGETLRSIAIKFKVSKNDLLQWNKQSKNKPVWAGDTLIIFPR